MHDDGEASLPQPGAVTPPASSPEPSTLGRRLGFAVWFDGVSSRRHEVVLFDDLDLHLIEGGAALARFSYADLRRMPGPDDRLVLHPVNAPPLARLELADAATREALLPLCPALVGPGAIKEAKAWTIVAWSLAAAASLALAVFVLIPIIAEKLVPFVPAGLEAQLGSVADQQMRTILRVKTCRDPAGLAALDTLVRTLAKAGNDETPPPVEVWNSTIPNAFALPGGRIRLFRGLLDEARSPDEVAGVLAHEIGHVVHRDGLRELLRSSASGYVLGFLFGDVAGAGVLLGAGSYLIDASFSRVAETQADAEALRRLDALGRPAKPLADLLARITGDGDSKIPAFLSTHPATPERAGQLAGRVEATGPAMLDETQWRALRGICKV